jgi:ubiquinone/menaquinone biosynthesis C-methylase UbiE
MPKLKPLINWSPRLYDKLAENYDRFAAWFFPIGDLGRERVVSGLEPGAILDVACGTGTLLEKAQLEGLNCFGIDTSWGMLTETRRKVSNAKVVQASFYALPFAGESFYYVVETNAVSGADINPDQVLSEMLRVCKSGGEIRLGDYGKSNRKGFWYRLLEIIGILIGDYPHDYQEIFEFLGYEAVVENLGWGGSYQFIQVYKSSG